METMHYSEKKKSSKGVVIGLLIFFVIGGAVLYFGIRTEKEPVLIGREETDIQRLVDIEQENSVQTANVNSAINYEVVDVKKSDTSNAIIKEEMTLPSIKVDGMELGEINVKIEKDYTELYDKLKEQLKTAESKYTYIVSYETYENMVDTNKIVSIVITQKIRDDVEKENTMEKKETYNIDLATKKTITEADVAQKLLGKEYKTIIRSAAREYVVDKGMLKDSEFTYALTGLENFYVKDNVYHIIFNEGELVDKKYGVLDVAVEKEE